MTRASSPSEWPGTTFCLRRRPHHVGHVVGEPGRHLEQPRLAGGAVVMNRGLDHRAGVVDVVLLVIVAAIEAPAMIWAPSIGSRC